MTQKYFLYAFLAFFSVMQQNAMAMKKARKSEHSEHQSQIKTILKKIADTNERFQKLSKPFKDDPAIGVDEKGKRYLKFAALKTIAGQHAYKELIKLDTAITRLYMEIDDLEDEFNENDGGLWSSDEEDTGGTEKEFPGKT